MPKGRPKILFAGGGTGGHLFPALAIADEVKRLQPNSYILFVGTKDKIEARVVPQRGYAFRTIWISGFQRRFTLNNLMFPVKVMVSLTQSFSLMKKVRPDAVVGTGGYVCGPVLYVASRLGIPTVVHESNSYPGVTTRLVAHRAAKVFTAFEETNRWLRRTDNIELVGTPVRQSLKNASRKDALRFFGLEERKKTVFVFGGSLGAASMNRAVEKCLQELTRANLQVIWQTGEKQSTEIHARFENNRSVWIGAFIDRMEYAYAAADIIVCRAGATTIAEITALGKPAILVPYPHAAADHQTQNALTLANANAAVMVSDRDAENQLKDVILSLMHDGKKRRAMSKSSKKLGRPEAGNIIASTLLELAGTSLRI